MSKFCPQCGAPVAPDVQKCEYCGAAIEQPVQQAPVQPVAPVQQVPVQQVPVQQMPPQQIYYVQNPAVAHERANWPVKNKLVAGLLALLLGGIGIHKFYLGQTGAGVLYLLLSWTFVPGIIALIEGITILCSSDENFMIKYKCRVG